MPMFKIEIPDEIHYHWHHEGGCMHIPLPTGQVMVGQPYVIVGTDDPELIDEIKSKLEGKYQVIGDDEIKQAMADEAELREKLKR